MGSRSPRSFSGHNRCRPSADFATKGAREERSRAGNWSFSSPARQARAASGGGVGTVRVRPTWKNKVSGQAKVDETDFPHTLGDAARRPGA